MTRMDTGQVILVDTPPESLTNGDVSMLDITKIEGIPLDAPKDGAVYYDEVFWGFVGLVNIVSSNGDRNHAVSQKPGICFVIFCRDFDYSFACGL